MKNFRKEWNNTDKIKVFEIPVIDKRTGNDEYILFHISLVGKKFIAQHEATTQAEELSNKIAFCSIDIDSDFSLDENLQELYSECIQKIIDSEFFELGE
jgi:hypothetical protein